MHPADRGLAATALEQAATGSVPLDVEVRLVHPDGTVRWHLTIARCSTPDQRQNCHQDFCTSA